VVGTRRRLAAVVLLVCASPFGCGSRTQLGLGDLEVSRVTSSGGAATLAGSGGAAGRATGGKGGKGGANGQSGSGGAGHGGASGFGAAGGKGGDAGSAPDAGPGAGGTGEAGESGSAGVDGGTVVEPPSCRDALERCGEGDSCCTSLNVDGSPSGYTQNGQPVVVEPFALDKYEVTVGRFQRFLNAYDQWHGVEHHPLNGEGTGAAGTGWDETWETGPWGGRSALAESAADLQTVLDSCTFRTSTQLDVLLPQNCLSWYEAVAFCLWDEARLPTVEEWNYAVTGGAQQRTYPWGNAPVPDDVNDDYAVYDCLADGDAACSVADIMRVGSRPLGVGRWGQLDLAGSVAEWSFGWTLTGTSLTRPCARMPGACAARASRADRMGGAATRFVLVEAWG
jgi:sulfatase modifying factor 1